MTTATLAIALALTSSSALAAAWWAARKVTQMADRMSEVALSLSTIQNELLSTTRERDQARFELSRVTTALEDNATRIRDLEEVIAQAPISYSAGLAPDDVRGRLRARIEGRKATAAPLGGPVSAFPGGAVPDTSSTAGAKRPDSLPGEHPDV